jgi:signal transduction histidine kinase/ligand-binding sensor domain-containing protein
MLSPASKAVVLTLGVTATAFLPAFAQERAVTLSHLYHTAWTSRSGAPADVQALAQTTDGFLWLGTQTGLFRFDGVRFELFEPAAPESLPSVSVRSLLALPEGGLWVGYQFGGVSLIRDGAIRSFGEQDGMPRGTVLSLVQDSGGVTWVGATGGLARFDDGRWHRVGPDEGIPAGQVTGMLADRRGRLWAAAVDGVFVRAPGASRFQRTALSYSSTVGYREQISLQDGADGTVWVSSPTIGLRRIHWPDGGRSAVTVDPRVSLSGAILIDRSGAFWLALSQNQGIERFGADGRSSQRMTQGLSADVVSVWLEDREGNVWAGTTGGLDQFRPTKLTRVDLPGTESNLAIAPADSGAVWVGSDGRRLIRVGDRLEEFPAVPSPVDVAYRDPDGVVWIGSPRGLWRFTRGGFAPVRLPEVENAGLQAVARDGSGDLWVSIVRNGVFRKVGERWVPFGGLEALPREPAVVLTTDQSGRTWFGYTGNRVALLERDSVRLYTAQDGLGVGIVLAIHARDSRVWVGGDRGLALIAEGRVRPLLGRGGLQFRGTSGIVETPAGEVWLNGAIGVTRIPADEVRRAVEDPRYQVTNERLDFRDGLTGSAAQIRPQPTLVAGTDGRLWFATTRGIAWLDPNAIPRNPAPPPVVVRRLTAGNVSHGLGPDLALPVNTRALRIDYTALSLSIPERVRFRYRLIGSDTGWQEVGGRREAFYTNLGPGSYRFHVTAANEDGVWNQDGALLDFTIPPSFTQTRWFLLVWVAALGLVIWLAYLARMQQVAGRLRLRYQAALAERARIAHELHDTLLQSFTGITMQLRAIERQLVHRPQEGAQALKDVLGSADMALRQARHMIWDMRAVELEGHDLAGALETAARSAVADSRVDLVFAVRGSPRRLTAEVETTALRIGREAVINAVKHAAPARVEVDLEYGPRALTVRVRDDGTGMSPDAMDTLSAGEHLGIAGMRDRAQRAGGTLDIASAPGRGTTVSAALPVREHRDGAHARSS